MLGGTTLGSCPGCITEVSGRPGGACWLAQGAAVGAIPIPPPPPAQGAVVVAPMLLGEVA